MRLRSMEQDTENWEKLEKIMWVETEVQYARAMDRICRRLMVEIYKFLAHIIKTTQVRAALSDKELSYFNQVFSKISTPVRFGFWSPRYGLKAAKKLFLQRLIIVRHRMMKQENLATILRSEPEHVDSETDSDSD